MKELERVMYIAPRFHTNQVFAIKSLLRNGLKVKFLSHYSHKTENYEDIEPVILGYSLLFSIFLKCICGLNDTKKAYYQRRLGFPPIMKVIREIKSFKPDLIIIRDRTIYSLICVFISKILQKKFIIYTQTPKYTKRKYKLKEKIKFIVFGEYEFTPILGKKNQGVEYYNEENTFIVPLIIEENKYLNSKLMAKEKNIRKIIIVSEFVERKRILETLEIIQKLIRQGYKMHVSVIGNAKKNDAKVYLERVKNYIKEQELDGIVKIKTDIPHNAVLKEYVKNDIFVFASTRESAGYALLEAMASGLAILCSTGVGLHEYLSNENYDNVFPDGDFNKLYCCLKNLLDNTELISQFGEENLQLVKTKYSSQNYFESIKTIWENI